MTAPSVITLRTLDSARTLPLEPSEDAPRLPRGEEHVCSLHGSPFKPVIVTTWGPFADPAVWRAHPLALDMWMCETHQHFAYARIAWEEVLELLKDGTAAADAGDRDEAEYCLRRVVASWPNVNQGRVNLATLYLARLEAAQAAGAAQEELLALAHVAVEQFERALACDPPAPVQVQLLLAEVYQRSGQPAAARESLESFLADPAAPPALHSRAQRMLEALRAPAAPAGERVVHPYLELTMPEGWKRAEPPAHVTACFEGPDHELVTVIIGEFPSHVEPVSTLAQLSAAHEDQVRKDHRRCDVEAVVHPPPGPAHVEARRRFFVQRDGPPWTVFTRYAVSTVVLLRADGSAVRPWVQITHHGSSWGNADAVVRAIESAVVMPKASAALGGAPEGVL